MSPLDEEDTHYYYIEYIVYHIVVSLVTVQILIV